ncbi:Cd(II)/Pb(II)-responsive transcriptional regulator [Undibacterium sp. Jales W-56]|uniref:Cd(II)/Pb(II)-responsive transcriptional regulator n=1 Tax=Undibacterium sp. Jales W-56 TaxID=2897325 RepID=UPI0029303FED|nr:Cd(II)/Pb(II)-responsive transcriptional regulator [Undibacterium sp. Jales W-56]
MPNDLKIGELAKRTGCLVETVRYYEKEQLLPQPGRSDGNFRLYNETHVERLQFIRNCRSLDMTLDEIRHLLKFKDLPNENCAQVNALLDEHIQHVAARIAELSSLQTQLHELRSLCQTAQASADCGILQNLASAEGSAPANFGSHSGGCH